MKLFTIYFSLSLLIAVLVLAIVSFASIKIANEQLVEEAKNHLRSVLIIKENQVRTFIDESHRDLRRIAASDVFTNHLSRIRADTPEADSYAGYVTETQVEARLIEEYRHSNYLDLQIYTVDGIIAAAAVHPDTNKFISQRPFFSEALVEPGSSPLYWDAGHQHPHLTIFYPFFDKKGLPVGGILANLNVSTIGNIMAERTGLGKTGETYILNDFGLVLSELRFEEGASFVKALHHETARACSAGRSGTGIYEDYRGEFVLGVYTWVPDLGLCFVAEKDISEVQAVQKPIIKNMVFISVIILLFVLAISMLVVREITGPAVQLSNLAVKVGRGNFDVRFPRSRTDEFRNLIEAFRHMVEDVKSMKTRLEEHSDALEGQVQERTKSLRKQIEEHADTKKALLNILEDVDETNKDLLITQNKLNETVRRLQLMDKQKDEFLSITAHELKTPLTSIQGFVSLLENPSIYRDKHKHGHIVSIIRQDSDRLAKLITDILDLSRLDMRSIKFNIDEFDINAMLDEIVNELVSFAKPYKVKLIPSFAGRDPMITSDSGRLKQIIINLVTNAVKYSKQGGSVHLSIKEKGRGFEIVVADKGRGISKETQKHIFERFYQGDSSYTRKVGGAGLGLSIVKEFTERLGGTIKIRSAPGRGTRFTLFFPRKGKINKSKTK